VTPREFIAVHGAPEGDIAHPGPWTDAEWLEYLHLAEPCGTDNEAAFAAQATKEI